MKDNIKSKCDECDLNITLEIKDITITQDEQSDCVLENTFSTVCPSCGEWTPLYDLTIDQESKIEAFYGE